MSNGREVWGRVSGRGGEGSGWEELYIPNFPESSGAPSRGWTAFPAFGSHPVAMG